ncbi:MAG: RlmE family RNA methyltransferase, partial [Zetaproteobacteria bacterium]
GSWSEELARRIGSRGIIVGIDLLEVRPIDGVRVIQGDFTDEAVQREIESCLDGRKVDLVVSDMAPEMSGNKVIDQARMMALNEATLDFAVHHLREGGNLLLKSFQGEGFDVFRGELMQRFARVRSVKPAASRKTSAEMFLLALDFLPMASECGA